MSNDSMEVRYLYTYKPEKDIMARARPVALTNCRKKEAKVE